MIPDTANDLVWADVFAAIDRTFDSPRPEHFTNHTHCCECSDADEFFQRHTPQSFSTLADPLETLPVAFLTDDAFLYLAPGIFRYLARSGEHYNFGDVLFFIEYRLDIFTAEQRAAIREVLYVAYDQLKAEIEDAPFDYHAMMRILEELDREASST